MSTRQRPLSPHLGIYRFMYTMATSIAHRITGIVLSVGLVVLVGWLFAAASGADRYAQASALLSTGFMKLLIAGWLLAFCYHLCNGTGTSVVASRRLRPAAARSSSWRSLWR